jgi:hypothetical protein
MRRRSSFAALALLCAVAVSLNAYAATVNFTADLAGPNERPEPTDSTATGTMTGQLTGDPGLFVFTYEITYEGLSGPATVGHIHDAINPDPNPPFTEKFGAPVHDLDSLESPITGDWTYLDVGQPLTDEHAANLIAGRMYVNIHSELFPNGEIRGQILAVDDGGGGGGGGGGGAIPLPAPLAIGLFGLSAAGVGAWKRQRVL